MSGNHSSAAKRLSSRPPTAVAIRSGDIPPSGRYGLSPLEESGFAHKPTELAMPAASLPPIPQGGRVPTEAPEIEVSEEGWVLPDEITESPATDSMQTLRPPPPIPDHRPYRYVDESQVRGFLPVSVFERRRYSAMVDLYHATIEHDTGRGGPHLYLFRRFTNRKGQLIGPFQFMRAARLIEQTTLAVQVQLIPAGIATMHTSYTSFTDREHCISFALLEDGTGVIHLLPER